jgi:hypothetical protein
MKCVLRAALAEKTWTRRSSILLTNCLIAASDKAAEAEIANAQTRRKLKRSRVVDVDDTFPERRGSSSEISMLRTRFHHLKQSCV